MTYGGGTPGNYQLRVDVARGIQLEWDDWYRNDSVGGANALTLTLGAPGHQGATVAGNIMGPEWRWTSAGWGNWVDVDVFQLGTLNAGNVVEAGVRLPASSTLDAKVTVVDSSGAAVADSDGNTSDGHALVTIAADGAYYVQVEATAGAGPLGRYLLDVDIADLVPPVVTAVPGLPVAGATGNSFIGAFSVQVSEDLNAATVNVLNPRRVWSYGGHFYVLTESVVTWTDAEAQAAARGGHLVTLNDQAEQGWVQQTFGRFGSIWIGLSDQAVTDTWEWSSGKPVTYTNWAPGWPNAYYSSVYGYHWAFLQGADGQWMHYPNGAYFRAVMEFDGVDSDGDGVPDGLDVAPTDPWTWNTWDLREAGPDGVFDTADDVLYHLSIAPPYTAGTSISVVIDDGPLADGHYRFTTNATIRDRVGNALDGNRDGVGGDAYQQVFDIAGTVPAGVSFEGRDNDTRQTATALTLVEDPAGSGYWLGRGVGRMEPTSDVDYWSFEAQAGDVVSVSVDTPGSDLNPYVELRNAADGGLAGDDNGGPDADAFVSHYVIPTSGTYYAPDHYTHRLASTCFCASIPRAKSLARCNPIQIVFGPGGPSAALLVKPPHSAIIATISLNAGGVVGAG